LPSIASHAHTTTLPTPPPVPCISTLHTAYTLPTFTQHCLAQHYPLHLPPTPAHLCLYAVQAHACTPATFASGTHYPTPTTLHLPRRGRFPTPVLPTWRAYPPPPRHTMLHLTTPPHHLPTPAPPTLPAATTGTPFDPPRPWPHTHLPHPHLHYTPTPTACRPGNPHYLFHCWTGPHTHATHTARTHHTLPRARWVDLLPQLPPAHALLHCHHLHTARPCLRHASSRLLTFLPSRAHLLGCMRTTCPCRRAPTAPLSQAVLPHAHSVRPHLLGRFGLVPLLYLHRPVRDVRTGRRTYSPSPPRTYPCPYTYYRFLPAPPTEQPRLPPASTLTCYRSTPPPLLPHDTMDGFTATPFLPSPRASRPAPAPPLTICGLRATARPPPGRHYDTAGLTTGYPPTFARFLAACTHFPFPCRPTPAPPHPALPYRTCFARSSLLRTTAAIPTIPPLRRATCPTIFCSAYWLPELHALPPPPTYRLRCLLLPAQFTTTARACLRYHNHLSPLPGTQTFLAALLHSWMAAPTGFTLRCGAHGLVTRLQLPTGTTVSLRAYATCRHLHTTRTHHTPTTTCHLPLPTPPCPAYYSGCPTCTSTIALATTPPLPAPPHRADTRTPVPARYAC